MLVATLAALSLAWSAPTALDGPGCARTSAADAIATAGTSTFVATRVENCPSSGAGAVVELSDAGARLTRVTTFASTGTLFGEAVVTESDTGSSATWLDARPAQRLTPDASSVVGATGPDGEIVLATGAHGGTRVRRAAPGMGFDAGVDVSGVQPSAVAIDPAGTAVVLVATDGGLTAAQFARGARPAREQRLTRKAEYGVLATGSEGTVVAAWTAPRRRPKPHNAQCWVPDREVWATVRPPGGRFGAPRRISRAVGTGVVHLDAGSGPGALLAWDEGIYKPPPPCVPSPGPPPKKPASRAALAGAAPRIAAREAAAPGVSEVQTARLVPGGLAETQVVARDVQVAVLDVATGPRGDAVLALEADRHAAALVIDADGSRCEWMHTGDALSSAFLSAPMVHVAIDAADRVTFVWPVGDAWSGRYSRAQLTAGMCG